MPKRKITILIAIILFLFLAGSFIYFLISKKTEEKPSVLKEKTIEELLQSVTAPAGGANKVSEKIIKSLTSPKGGKVSEDVIKSLTVPK